MSHWTSYISRIRGETAMDKPRTKGGKDLSSAIRNFIVRQFPIARKTSLGDDVALLTSGIVDSLGMLDLVRFLEQSFTIHVDDEELTPENFATIGSLASFVEHKRNQIEAIAQ
jgi:acyl carrier protein